MTNIEVRSTNNDITVRPRQSQIDIEIPNAPKGDTGVVGAISPMSYNSVSKTISIDLSAYATISSLSLVASTGKYSDLSGKPTLGSAAATSSSDYATAAQGTDQRVPTDNSVSTNKIVNAAVTSDKLADTTVNFGSYGLATSVPTITVDSKGRLTAASNTSIQISQSQVNSLVSDLSAKAPLASPTLTGTPSAPTAISGTNTTQIATTAYVRGEISSIIDSAPSTLDTLNELAAALGDDPNFATTISNALGNKQPLDADLTAIAGLSGTSGLLKKTAADTWTLDTNSYLTGNQSITVSGDASGSGSTSISLTLSNSGVSQGTYNNVSSEVRPFTVDAKGRITSIGAAVPISISQSSVTNLTTDLASKVSSNDSRLTDNRTPLDNSVTYSKMASNSALVVSNEAPESPKIGTMWVDANDTVENIVFPLQTASISNGAITSPLLATSLSLSGIPTAPTAVQDTNTTQIATTEFVISQGYLKNSENPFVSQISSSSETYGILKKTAANVWEIDSNQRAVYVQASAPSVSGSYVWIQTGLGDDGTDMTFWIEDGS